MSIRRRPGAPCSKPHNASSRQRTACCASWSVALSSAIRVLSAAHSAFTRSCSPASRQTQVTTPSKPQPLAASVSVTLTGARKSGHATAAHQARLRRRLEVRLPRLLQAHSLQLPPQLVHLPLRPRQSPSGSILCPASQPTAAPSSGCSRASSSAKPHQGHSCAMQRQELVLGDFKLLQWDHKFLPA